MRINNAFIQELIARTDIVEIVGRYLHLKKSGRNYAACCPFHDEKTSSFTINPNKQLYHCFGCGAGGNVINFIMAHQSMGFLDAVITLSEIMGVPVVYDSEQHAPRKNHNELYDLMHAVSAYYVAQLGSSEGKTARDYLAKRGIDGEQIKKYQLGYAPNLWDGVLKAFSDKKDLLLQSGLLSEGERGQQYDRFRHRLVFPINDHRGRVVAFGGRVFDESKPKYLNSPETAIFHKSDVLYGFTQARLSQPLDCLIVVEGYSDVIALSQHGINNAVSILGTGLSDNHLKQLFRSVSRLVFCFDGDAAGYKAAWAALQSCLPFMDGTLQVQFLFLPDGDDPDSAVRRLGASGFSGLLQKAVPLSHFLFAHVTKDNNLSVLEGRAAVAEAVKPLLARCPDSAYRALLNQKLNELTQVNFKQFAHKQPAPRRTEFLTPIESAICLLLQSPQLHAHCDDIYGMVSGFDSDTAHFLMAIIDLLQQSPNITPALMFEHFRGSVYESILAKYAISDTAPINAEIEIEGVSQQIKQQFHKQRINSLLSKGGLNQLTPAEKQEFVQLTSIISRVGE